MDISDEDGRDKWINRFLELAMSISDWSKDPHRKVGAVIVDHARRVLGIGYNGFPRGVDDDPVRYENKSVKLAMVVHAEANAILNSAGRTLVGSTIYVTSYPCTECSKLLIQSGIDTVVCPPPALEGKWADDSMIAKQMLTEACVTQITVRLPRGGMSMEEYYEDGLRKIVKELEPKRDPQCDTMMNKHIGNCECELPRVDMVQDTISRLLRVKSV